MTERSDADRSDLATYWPPARLRIVGPRVELRMPSDSELLALAEVAIDGAHEPDYMPFAAPWSDAPAQELGRSLIQWHWTNRVKIAPASWNLLLGVFVDGNIIGAQDVVAKTFDPVGVVETASWIGRRFHGNGYGTEMREAVLAFAFDGLGARSATSGAYVDNPASLRVSEKCGYRPNGSRLVERTRGERAPGGASSEVVEELRVRLDATDWRARTDRPEITVHGLDDDLRAMLGAAPD